MQGRIVGFQGNYPLIQRVNSDCADSSGDGGGSSCNASLSFTDFLAPLGVFKKDVKQHLSVVIDGEPVPYAAYMVKVATSQLDDDKLWTSTLKPVLARAHLEPKSKATDANLWSLTQLQRDQCKSRFVYRVCRPDQSATIAEQKPLTARNVAEVDGLDLVTYFQSLWQHVRCGSKEAAARSSPFISCTTHLPTALHWSRCGVFDIIQIDLASVNAAKQAWFDLNFDGGLWLARKEMNVALNFAMASNEVVISRSIPPDAYAVVDVNIHPLALQCFHRDVVADPNVANPHFPADLSGLCDGSGSIKLERVFTGTSTEPLQVSAQLREGRPPAQFVLKQGGRVSDRNSAIFNHQQVETEFTAFLAYAAASVPVPSAALYTSTVEASCPFDQEVCWLSVKHLLTEFINGDQYSVDDKLQTQALHAHVAMDIALSNYDAFGPQYANIIMVQGAAAGSTDAWRAYRIDANGAGGFNPKGDVAVDRQTKFYGGKGRQKKQVTSAAGAGAGAGAASSSSAQQRDDADDGGDANIDDGGNDDSLAALPAAELTAAQRKQLKQSKDIIEKAWTDAISTRAGKRDSAANIRKMLFGSENPSAYRHERRDLLQRLMSRGDILPGQQRFLTAARNQLRALFKQVCSDEDRKLVEDVDTAVDIFDTSIAKRAVVVPRSKSAVKSSSGSSSSSPSGRAPSAAAAPQQAGATLSTSASSSHSNGNGAANPVFADGSGASGVQASSNSSASAPPATEAQTITIAPELPIPSGFTASQSRAHAAEPAAAFGAATGWHPGIGVHGPHRTSMALSTPAIAGPRIGWPSAAAPRATMGQAPPPIRLQFPVVRLGDLIDQERRSIEHASIQHHGLAVVVRRTSGAPMQSPHQSDTLRVINLLHDGPDKFRMLSPLYPHSDATGHPGLDVPGNVHGARSYTVEGIWQGLKVIRHECASGMASWTAGLMCTDPVELKRKRGLVLGHYYGDGHLLLPYLEARTRIFVPAYKQKLERYCASLLPELASWLQQRPDRCLILIDDHIADLNDLSSPLSHAMLVKRCLYHLLRRLDAYSLAQANGLHAASSNPAPTHVLPFAATAAHDVAPQGNGDGVMCATNGNASGNALDSASVGVAGTASAAATALAVDSAGAMPSTALGLPPAASASTAAVPIATASRRPAPIPLVRVASAAPPSARVAAAVNDLIDDEDEVWVSDDDDASDDDNTSVTSDASTVPDTTHYRHQLHSDGTSDGSSVRALPAAGDEMRVSSAHHTSNSSSVGRGLTALPTSAEQRKDAASGAVGGIGTSGADGDERSGQLPPRASKRPLGDIGDDGPDGTTARLNGNKSMRIVAFAVAQLSVPADSTPSAQRSAVPSRDAAASAGAGVTNPGSSTAALRVASPASQTSSADRIGNSIIKRLATVTSVGILDLFQLCSAVQGLSPKVALSSSIPSALQQLHGYSVAVAQIPEYSVATRLTALTAGLLQRLGLAVQQPPMSSAAGRSLSNPALDIPLHGTPSSPHASGDDASVSRPLDRTHGQPASTTAGPPRPAVVAAGMERPAVKRPR